jgi:hypothetical protein
VINIQDIEYINHEGFLILPISSNSSAFSMKAILLRGDRHSTIKDLISLVSFNSTYINIYIYVCMYVQICTPSYIYIYIHISLYVYINRYIYTSHSSNSSNISTTSPVFRRAVANLDLNRESGLPI